MAHSTPSVTFKLSRRMTKESKSCSASTDEVGRHFKAVRKQLRLSLRQVQAATMHVAAERSNRDYIVSATTLHSIENWGTVPTVFKLYSLSVVYKRPLAEILGWFGI